MPGDRLPSENQLQPAHIGEIGEALFSATYNPPDPIPALIREFCAKDLPDWVDPDSFSISSLVSEGHQYSVERDGEEMRWERDAIINVFRSRTQEERERTDRTLSMEWSRKFPVEIKTGSEATTRNDQRKVMRYLAQHTEYQPVLVRLRIDSLPNAFSVTDVEFIGQE